MIYSFALAPQHNSSVDSSRMSVSIKNTICTPFFSSTFGRYGVSISFTFCSSSLLMEFNCPTPNTISLTVNCLKSWKQISSAVFPARLLPALNIACACSSRLIPAIFASFLAIFSSSGVQVGERNKSVSEIIAEHRSPAIVGLISTSFSLYI